MPITTEEVINMKIFHKVLDRAKEEGKIDTRFIPWEGQTPEDTGKGKLILEEYDLSHMLSKFPDELLDDFQKIIENIRSSASGNDSHVIGITSAVPRQGNSTLATLLSLTIMENESRYFGSALSGEMNQLKNQNGVLLIDAQVRHPSLHTMLEVPARKGLNDLLTSDVPLEEVIKEVEHSKLNLITIGDETGFRYTQSMLEKFHQFLRKTIENRYEFIFVDIPPILHYAEGLALSNLCDGMIFIVSAGRARLEVVKEAKRLMERSRVPVFGAILNRRKYYIPDWIYGRL
jgi:Mrp family chromosome partitioning ATPase